MFASGTLTSWILVNAGSISPSIDVTYFRVYHKIIPIFNHKTRVIIYTEFVMVIFGKCSVSVHSTHF